jgi:urease accessory protein
MHLKHQPFVRIARQPRSHLLHCLIAAVLVAIPELASAHIGAGTMGYGGFTSGLVHPVTGLDHVVAMVAVGLWGAILGAPAIWALPIAFPLIMTFGAVLGVLGVPLPGIETGIAASGIVLGSMVMLNARPPLAVALVLISVFAIFHGHAHGAELPETGIPVYFVAGFVISTGLLHLSGIALGLLLRWPAGRVAVRGAGAGIAAVGVYFLVAALGASV